MSQGVLSGGVAILLPKSARKDVLHRLLAGESNNELIEGVQVLMYPSVRLSQCSCSHKAFFAQPSQLHDPCNHTLLSSDAASNG